MSCPFWQLFNSMFLSFSRALFRIASQIAIASRLADSNGGEGSQVGSSPKVVQEHSASTHSGIQGKQMNLIKSLLRSLGGVSVLVPHFMFALFPPLSLSPEIQRWLSMCAL